MMIRTPLLALALTACVGPAWAQDAAPADNKTFPHRLEGQSDDLTGQATRQWLTEQAQGINRGDVEPYRAESAGKAYRAYVDAIGTKEAKTGSGSQITGVSGR